MRTVGKSITGFNVELRDYQLNCVDAIFAQWEKVCSTCVVMCTGGGKTVIFSRVIERKGCRTLVLAHRRELIFQACRTIRAVTGIEPEIEMGWSRVETNGFHLPQIVVATVQSMANRLEKWKPMDFGLIICDEFHHGTAGTYRKIFDHFKQNPSVKILGVTATPDRADEEALSQVCDSVAFTFDIFDGVNAGWLVPITAQYCEVASLDLSHVRTTAGELNQGDLAKIMEAEENVQGVCQPALEVLHGLPPKTLSAVPVPEWREYIANLNKVPRRAIVFTVSVAQAEACCNILNRVVPGIAEWIEGKTPEEDREAILKRYQAGDTPVVVNCAVLTEGFDAPSTEVIFMAKPTKSRALYTQMVGRSTRPLPGIVDGLETPEARKQAIDASPKPRCRIIDFAGNSGRHKLVSALDIMGGKCTLEALELAKRKALKEGKPVTVLRTLSNAEIELENERKALAERKRLAEEARKRNVVAKVDFNVRDVDPFGRNGQGRFFTHNGKNLKTPPSEAQCWRLGFYGIRPNGWTKKQASMILGKLRGKDGWVSRDKFPKELEWTRKH